MLETSVFNCFNANVTTYSTFFSVLFGLLKVLMWYPQQLQDSSSSCLCTWAIVCLHFFWCCLAGCTWVLLVFSCDSFWGHGQPITIEIFIDILNMCKRYHYCKIKETACCGNIGVRVQKALIVILYMCVCVFHIQLSLIGHTLVRYSVWSELGKNSL